MGESMNKEEEADRISSLPDDLLRHILSFLPTAPYAVRTGLLSKRWRHVWASIQTLHLDGRLMNRQCHNIHRTIVDRFVLNRDPSVPIRKLRLHCTQRSAQISHYETLQLLFRSCPVLEELVIDAWDFGHQNHQGMLLLGAVADSINSLSLSAQAMCVLGPACGRDMPKFPNLTRLELRVFDGYSWNLVIDFLKMSPRLEIFVLEKESARCWHCLDAQSWSPRQAVPDCFLSHLKVMEIVGFRGQQDESELLEYLFQNTKVLNRFVINSSKLDADINALFKNVLFDERKICKSK